MYLTVFDNNGKVLIPQSVRDHIYCLSIIYRCMLLLPITNLTYNVTYLLLKFHDTFVLMFPYIVYSAFIQKVINIVISYTK